MAIVDAHIHLWEKGTPRGAHRQQPYSAEQALADMDEAGVTAAVIQPPAWDPDANRVAVAAAARYPGRFAVLGNFPLDAADREHRLRTWKEQPGMLGLRYIFNQPEHGRWLAGRELDWLWRGAQREGLPIAIAASRFLPSLARIAERFPGLHLIIDHLGVPVDAVDDAAFAHLPQLLELACEPNIAVKATGVQVYASDAYPYASLHQRLRIIFEAFGPHRFFWGTDITKMPCTWRQCVQLFTDDLPWLAPGDKAQVMGDALCRWTDWDRS